MKKHDYLSVVYNRDQRPKTAYVRKHVEILVSNFNLSLSDSLLEIGCGNCNILNEFSAFDLSVKGVDLSVLSGSEYPYIEVVIGDIEKSPLPFPSSSFDVIFSKSVVEHLSDPAVYFSEAFRLLKPGGKLITMTPDWEVQLHKFYDNWTHKSPFTLPKLRSLLRLYSFVSPQVFYFKQLPCLWNNRYLLLFSNILAPFIHERERSKLRWIRERQILSCGVKP